MEKTITKTETKKANGGRGKAEWIRNKAIAVLHEHDPKTFNSNTLSGLFGRDRKTIAGIIERYSAKPEARAYNVKRSQEPNNELDDDKGGSIQTK